LKECDAVASAAFAGVVVFITQITARLAPSPDTALGQALRTAPISPASGP
jgi:hypothetical protein